MKSGFAALGGWLVQRVSALLLLVLGLPLLVRLVLVPPAGYDAWRHWAGLPAVQLWLVALFVALALHAWVGTRDVVMDYVKPLPLRLAVLALVASAIAATLLWLALVLVRL